MGSGGCDTFFPPRRGGIGRNSSGRAARFRRSGGLSAAPDDAHRSRCAVHAWKGLESRPAASKCLTTVALPTLATLHCCTAAAAGCLAYLQLLPGPWKLAADHLGCSLPLSSSSFSYPPLLHSCSMDTADEAARGRVHRVSAEEGGWIRRGGGLRGQVVRKAVAGEGSSTRVRGADRGRGLT
jgi:hypothetical protein